jgi:flagellar protein FliO/FliZ
LGAQLGTAMEYLQPPYTYYAVAALAVIGVLIISVIIAGAIGGRVRGRRGSRLGISEYREIDKQRRLVLVRRDGVEHLLLIGGNDDLVVESGITSDAAAGRARRRAVAAADDSHGEADEPVLRVVKSRPAPRPPVFGDHAPSSRQSDREPPQLMPGGFKPDSE